MLAGQEILRQTVRRVARCIMQRVVQQLFVALVCTIPALAVALPGSVPRMAPQTELDSMGIDSAVSPCADFYQYANGSWLARATITSADTATGRLWGLTKADRIGFFAEFAQQTQETLQHVLERARITAMMTSDPLKRVVGEFYGSCLATLASQSPVPSLPEQHWRCFSVTDSLLGPALGELYTRAVFPPGVRARAIAFVAALRAAMHDRLVHAPWASDSTRARAVQKLQNFTVQLGAPQEQEDYHALHLSSTNFEQNARTIKEFEYQRKLTLIGTQLPETWDDHPYTINAEQHLGSAWVEVPAVWWQSPVFDPDRDLANTYGTVGVIVAHEFMHGFGVVGRNAAGGQVFFDWIDPRDTAAFTTRTQRLAQQADSFVIKPARHGTGTLRLDGTRTLEENLADLNGLRVAYNAFEQARHQPTHETHDRSAHHVGAFTPEQRFFLAYANLWRAKPIDEAWDSFNTHAPERFRVNGPLANMPEFAHAFGCKDGDPMVRPARQRAELW